MLIDCVIDEASGQQSAISSYILGEAKVTHDF